jgi:plasmid stability protein
MRRGVSSHIMARTTLDLDPAVLRELRIRSRNSKKSMGRVASEILAQALSHPNDTPGPPFQWVSRDLGVPVVNLEDKEAVRAILDASE